MSTQEPSQNEPGWPNHPPPAEYLQRTQFFSPLAKPLMTYGLIVVNLLVFLAMIVYGYQKFGDFNGSENSDVLIAFGAKFMPLIVQGEYWRLFTAMFVHIGITHILFNLYSLYSLGTLAESYFGHARFLIIYILGGLFGSLASYWFSVSLSAGASGAIFAVAGGITVYFMIYRENFGSRGRAILQNMLVVIAINIFFGLSSRGIDNWGHLGGLVGGAVVAWGIVPRYQRPQISLPGVYPLQIQQRKPLEIGWSALWTVALIAGTYWATQTNLALYFR